MTSLEPKDRLGSHSFGGVQTACERLVYTTAVIAGRSYRHYRSCHARDQLRTCNSESRFVVERPDLRLNAIYHGHQIGVLTNSPLLALPR